MSPTNFFLDFDNLFQTNPAERFGTDELDSFDEEFAALLSSFVNTTPLPSATPMVKQDLPEKTFEQIGETFTKVSQTPIIFDSVIDSAKPATQEFPKINQILQPTNLFRAEEINLPVSDDTPTQIKLPEAMEIEDTTPPFNPPQITSDDVPKAAETVDNTFHFVKENPEVKSNLMTAENKTSNLIIAENKTAESQNKPEFSPSALEQSKQIETQKESDLPIQSALHAGFEPKTSDNSKKVLVVDREVKIEKPHKTSKQLEFEKKKQFFPIVQVDEITETAKPKASANFQTVLENFTELNENPTPLLKKIKLESGSTAFYEQPAGQENFTKELSFTESQPITFEQFVENVPEQVIEPMILLAKETGKTDAPRTIKIKLNPEELGTVEISLEGSPSGKLHAELLTETKTAEAVLNSNITELQKALEISGWQVETLTVSCKDTNSGQPEKQSQQAEKPRNFNNSSFISESETVSTEADDRLLSVRV